MKDRILRTTLFVLVTINIGYSQTFNSTPNMAIPDNGPETCNSINVTGVGVIDGVTTSITSVGVYITHTFDDDLDIYLVAPDNTRIELSTDNGGGGDDYGIGFDGSGINVDLLCYFEIGGTDGNITGGTAPFQGNYIPEGNLDDANNGQNADGNWQLCITDDASGDLGTVVYWEITFGAPPPPTVGGTFSDSPGMSIPDNGPETCSSINVSGVGAIDGTTISLESVGVYITHTYDGDLDIYLVAPDATRVELSTDNGGGGYNYGVGSGNSQLCYFEIGGSDGDITDGSAPFQGSYNPEGSFSDVNNGQDADGNWQLCISDDAGGDTGTLVYWELNFGNSVLPPCIDPSALTTSAITAVTADLGWTENGTATQWDIELGTAGFVSTGTPTANNVGSNPYTYTGLSPNTSYDFYVRADCGGNNSAWIGPFNFTTLTAPCTDPSALTASNITSSYADLGWTENMFATQWDIELGTAGFSPTGTPTANNVDANPYTYLGLSASTSYDFYVRADCGGTTSNWVGPFNFSTTASLPAGTDCANPFVIAALPFIQTEMTTSGFGNDYASADGCGSFTSSLSSDDFVIEYTPPVDECVKITLTNTIIGGYKDVGIHAYNSCPLNSGSCMGNVVFDSIPYFPNIPLIGGTTYYFIISARTGPTPFDLRMESVPCVDESNDECINAITLIQDTVCDPTIGSFWSATNDGTEGTCESTNKDDVWYKFVATSVDPVIFVERFGTITIAGGSHVDALPKEALSSGIDIVVHGEGEKTIMGIRAPSFLIRWATMFGKQMPS